MTFTMVETHIDGPSRVLGRFGSLLALSFRQKRFQILSAVSQWPSVFCYAIVIGISRVHAIDNVVGERRNNHIHLSPVVDAPILLLVKIAYLFILYGFELQGRH
jgi:hypothetical protein